MGSHTDKYTDSVWSRTTYGAEYPRYLLCEVQQLSPGKLRFVFLERSMRLVYPVGERCVLYLTQNKRENDTIFLNRCSRVTIENVTIRRGPCMGIIAQQCSDITVKNMKIAPLPGRGDLITTTTDSMMFVDCSGRICINGCYISCSLDDGINIHGTYVPIDRSNDSVVFAHMGHAQQKGYNPFCPGDEVQFIDDMALTTLGVRRVIKSVMAKDKVSLNVFFDRAVPTGVRKGCLMQNLTRQPEVEIVDSEYFNSTCLMISTAKPVLFARNRVRTLCEAIRFVDDTCKWYEAGKTQGVVIKDNVFERCAEWSDGYLIRFIVHSKGEPQVISHENIRISNNVFFGRNSKLLQAEGTDHLTFSDNVYSYTETSTQEEMFLLNRCGNSVSLEPPR